MSRIIPQTVKAQLYLSGVFAWVGVGLLLFSVTHLGNANLPLVARMLHLQRVGVLVLGEITEVRHSSQHPAAGGDSRSHQHPVTVSYDVDGEPHSVDAFLSVPTGEPRPVVGGQIELRVHPDDSSYAYPVGGATGPWAGFSLANALGWGLAALYALLYQVRCTWRVVRLLAIGERTASRPAVVAGPSTRRAQGESLFVFYDTPNGNYEIVWAGPAVVERGGDVLQVLYHPQHPNHAVALEQLAPPVELRGDCWGVREPSFGAARSLWLLPIPLGMFLVGPFGLAAPLLPLAIALVVPFVVLVWVVWWAFQSKTSQESFWATSLYRFRRSVGLANDPEG